ncbi:MAG: aspartate-semialdehyde dehydrogenase [Pseudomonas sp.]|uniref:aspartate-semialdehyde dehydrogenase n=1 Tax=Pseudomonas abieticivorans TaxID=2931382 RepID=UPI0020BD8D5D|nr:aspartate-semialdehyde dehydrogenase [Pseudomonas sp. PIA16]MDE1164130.1 aspartate-semialdehyde dehydrogenase [Pseudomonas sp.]
MLPPILPLSAVPVTSQLDPVRPRPDIPPVAPAQPTQSDNDIDLRQRDREQAAQLLREEHERQSRKRRDREEADNDPEHHQPVPGHELNADNTVPVAPLIDDEPRQGLWVDIQV